MKPDRYSGMIFLAAPREMSLARFKQIVKHYLPKASILVGISNEAYVVGFENQPQFAMLRRSMVQPIIDRVNAAGGSHVIEILEYSQAELENIVAEHAISVNFIFFFTFAPRKLCLY